MNLKIDSMSELRCFLTMRIVVRYDSSQQHETFNDHSEFQSKTRKDQVCQYVATDFIIADANNGDTALGLYSITFSYQLQADVKT